MFQDLVLRLCHTVSVNIIFFSGDGNGAGELGNLKVSEIMEITA